MNQATPENWERIARQEDAENDRLYRAALESAIDKLDVGIARRARMPALKLDEMKALRQFYRQFGS